MQTQPITIKDLQALGDAHMKIDQLTSEYFAGRCLLDALQFLRNDPKWPARSGHLVNAHAIRLCWGCLKDLGEDYSKRIELYVKETFERLRLGRNRAVPFYGDDFWDWAYILEAMVSVSDTFPDDRSKKNLADEVNEFYRSVNERLDCGLSLNKSGVEEWFGPATPTAAHRLLRTAKDYVEDKSGFEACLSNLKSKALEPINNGEYLERAVRPEYHQWHLGQVVAEFGEDAKVQREALNNIKDIDSLNDIRDKAYALARVVQGALAVGDKHNSDAALAKLYECENLSRPLGSGIVGDHPKASLNTLEAIWQSLRPADLKKIARMVDMLIAAHKRTNRIGILVALKRERDACIAQFEADGAKQTEIGDVVEINHKDYEVVILTGKAIIEAAVVTANLINEHDVTRVMMVGIAGSLGQPLGRKSKGQRKSKGRRKFKPQPIFKGPLIGDIVIATSTAEYGLRQKV